jgi:hypothetical protein
MKMPNSTRIMKTAGAAVIAVVLASCTGFREPSFPLPDDPGLYAVTRDDQLQRLDGDREWEIESWPARASMGPYTTFVIFEPDLEYDARLREELVELWRVAWVRSEIDSRGLAGPAAGSEWVVAPIEPFRVPASLEYADGYPEYVHIVPSSPLEPGLYSLRLDRPGSNRAGRVGVDWAAVDKRDYSAVNCVDRYAGSEPAYRPCVADSGVIESSAAEGLEITLVDPLRRDDALIVQGVVVNTTSITKTVPTMQTVLLDNAGRRLTQAMIEPRQVDLAPGERMTFKTTIAGAPATTARVDVDFVPMTNAGM